MSDVDRVADAGIVAILRHLCAKRAAEVGDALVRAGVPVMEVPLNDELAALESIRVLTETFGDDAYVGAGTVTDPGQVERVRAAGGRFVVSPDTNPDVIGATVGAGLVSCPGIATPSDAFTALRSGADALKLFPASVFGPGGLTALRDVLPPSTPVLAVGGVSVDNAGGWRAAGASGLGVGSALFRPDLSTDEIHDGAKAFVAAWAASAGAVTTEHDR